MRTHFFVAAAAAALLAGCGLGAPSYPTFSETAYRIEGATTPPDGGASTTTVIYRDGPKMRVEATLPNYGQAAIVFDESTNAAYVLNPTAQGALAAQTAAPAQTATVQTTESAAGQQTTTTAPTQVVGVAVRLREADAPHPLETAWAALGADNARSTGPCEVAGETGHEWTPREATSGVDRTACITDDGIVLRVRENNRVLWEATRLQRGNQDAALFGVPPGYQLIDPQAVAHRVGENLEQLDSVTGAPPPNQTAPDPRG